MKMTLKAKHVCHQTCIYPACEASNTLFQLIKRTEIHPMELPLIARLGFEIDIKHDDWVIPEEVKEELDYMKQIAILKKELINARALLQAYEKQSKTEALRPPAKILKSDSE